MVAQVEVPDGYRVVTLVGGESDGTPQIVQLDGTGRIVAVIQGEIEGITGPVDVSQTNSVRQIQGTDGSTLRTVKLDANGQIIMVPRGQSGNYMSVDASGFLTSVMKGDYTGTPTTLAVDSSGNIVAVIKGEYSGVLKTVATDADGRMIMIPTDPADVWGNAIGVGNAELAASLSHAKRYDRRGNIRFLDDFEDGLGVWRIDAQGTLAGVALSAARCMSGAFSAKLTGGSSGLEYASVAKYIQFPPTGRVGVEVLFSRGSNLKTAQLSLTFVTAAAIKSASVRCVTATDDFEYRDSAAAWQDIDADKPLLTYDYLFNHLKLVVDVEQWHFVRAILNGEEYDLSGIDILSFGGATGPYLIASFAAYSDTGTNCVVYVDSVVYTVNEPA